MKFDSRQAQQSASDVLGAQVFFQGLVLWLLGLSVGATPLLGQQRDPFDVRVGQYATVRLTTDLSQLTDQQRKMLPILIDAAQEMDAVFWMEAYGDKEQLLGGLSGARRQFAEINYGPWDRLNDNESFLERVGAKNPGANFYPADMTAEEFNQHLELHPEDRTDLKSLYTLIRRDADGQLIAVPYREAFADHIQRAAEQLTAAAELAEDDGLRKYLAARAEALLSDDYQQSDRVWLDMKNNQIDIVIGPIETYEDQLFGNKAAHEGYVLVKDLQWSEKLSKYAKLLPRLQQILPVDDKYKQEQPGSNSDLNAYDVVYYAGDCNAGSKTIAINLPNDEQVQLEKGTRRLQLKNAMRAKFDRIMEPIADELIAADQRDHVTFDAFFSNTMFHEVAHGLGIKYTINDQGSVREALRELASSIEEGKADILGLFMVTQLCEQGEVKGGTLEDYYVTFMAGIFRSVRFGASSAHGKANMVRFNFFREMDAFSRQANGKYRIDMEKMAQAIKELTAKLLTLQGDGDYAATAQLLEDYGEIRPTLRSDLERLSRKGVPVDVVFEQGVDVLGL